MTATATTADLEPAIAAGLHALGRPAAPALAAALAAYLALLDRWNRTYNLTAVRDPHDMVARHLLDSLAIAPYVGTGTLVDIGSGAGLPGIPLALADPLLRVTLVESNGKKARFLRTVQRQLELDNVHVLEARAEAVDAAGAFDCLTARALGTLAELVRVGGHLLAPGGRLLAMKGQIPADEIAALPSGWGVSEIHTLQVPGVDGQRHLLIVRRTDPGTATPAVISTPGAAAGRRAE